MELNSAVGGGPDFYAYELMAEMIGSVLPLLLELGVATEEEVDI